MKPTSLNRRKFLGATTGAIFSSILPWKTARSKNSSTLSFNRDIPIIEAYDAVVCGGGPAGIAAVLAARRAKQKVLLIESQGQLGGMSISGLVSHWLGGRTDDGSRWAVGGLFRTMVQEAEKAGIALIPTPDSEIKYQPHGWYKGQLATGIPFDPYAMAAFLDEKIETGGINLLLLTQVVDVRVSQNRITHVIIFNKSGLAAVPATAVIDATGDADIAARSGCRYVKGRESDGLTTPATLQFHVTHVNQDELAKYITTHDSPRFRERIKELRQAGEWPFPYDIFISVQLHEKGSMMINTSRLTGIDGTDGKSVTRGMIHGRRETQQLFELMKKHFPGFQNARIKSVAPLLGVRETRRILGQYTLTVDDLIEGKEFPDTIGFSAYGWDLPDPKRPSYQPMHDKQMQKKLPVTPIPYRLLVPHPVENLICPGRAISVERDVLGPLRVMAPCFAMGEAAGIAAAQVVKNKIEFRNIDVKMLREALKQNGAVVEWISEQEKF